jgi:hypothetical protein
MNAPSGTPDGAFITRSDHNRSPVGPAPVGTSLRSARDWQSGWSGVPAHTARCSRHYALHPDALRAHAQRTGSQAGCGSRGSVAHRSAPGTRVPVVSGVTDRAVRSLGNQTPNGEPDSVVRYQCRICGSPIRMVAFIASRTPTEDFDARARRSRCGARLSQALGMQSPG